MKNTWSLGKPFVTTLPTAEGNEPTFGPYQLSTANRSDNSQDYNGAVETDPWPGLRSPVIESDSTAVADRRVYPHATMLRQASFNNAQQDVSEKAPDASLAPAIGISNALVISAIMWACLYGLLVFVL